MVQKKRVTDMGEKACQLAVRMGPAFDWDDFAERCGRSPLTAKAWRLSGKIPNGFVVHALTVAHAGVESLTAAIRAIENGEGSSPAGEQSPDN